MKDKKFIVLIILLICGAVSTGLIKISKKEFPAASSVFNLPQEIGEYKSKDVKLNDETYKILETRNVIMRYYIKENEPPILFYLIFSESTHKTSDPPENCLQGEGRVITLKEKEIIPNALEQKSFGLTVNKLLVEKGKDKQIFLYWFIAGDKFLDSYFKQRLKLIFAYLKRTPLSGGQIRISTEVINHDEQEALQRLKAFINTCQPFLLDLLG
ncbi:MAG: exosortase C-terminal domain/associated protein EpsI [Candidatus Omnitrophota bacterium]